MPTRSLILALALQTPAASDPHQSYWQQEVHYEIAASLDEARGTLGGSERVWYINHAPDTLRTFSLHLYLNAFRPGSRWADADSVEGRRRFNDLKDPDFGFNHVREVRIMGEPVEASYPFAPDSTVVRFQLPRALAPDDSLLAELQWDARPSTVPRRQGRQGRRFDFAQWYPRVVTYDRHGWNEHPLYPAGEFYGEFGTFLVELDVPADEVIGATGVPLCGDPGWEHANQKPGRPVEYGRERYPDAPTYRQIGPACYRVPAPGPPGEPRDRALVYGRKDVVWYAEDVHHFAMSFNPDYRYEGGHWGNVAIHVLYQPGDDSTWGHGVAVQRTAKALAWLDQVFGTFVWPQVTNVHRIEGGGTEFPMMIMDGSAGQGLIVHELGHNYVMGILANNEWREGWLDEGFTSFQSTLFDEAQGQLGGYEGDEAGILGLDLDGQSEPASLVSEKYRDFTSYNISIYTRGELFFHQLRYVVGDATLLQILHAYYDRWKLKHVDEAAFREVAEEVSGLDLSTLFAQWLHGTELFDYAVGRVKRTQVTDSGFVTRIEVVRKAPGRLAVEVAVLAEHDTAVGRSEGAAEREWVTVVTRTKPKEVRLDPRGRTHDWNMLNNRRRLGGFSLSGSRPVSNYLDTYFTTPVHRNRLAIGWLPMAWYNDAGGLTLGLRQRDNYFGRFELNQSLVSVATGWGRDSAATDVDFFFRLKNPVALRSPGLSESVEGFNVEGRYGGRLALEHTHRDHLSFGPERRVGFTLDWVATDDSRYLDPGFYDNVGTVELRLEGGVSNRTTNGWQLGVNGSAGGGLVYNRNGLTASGPSKLNPFYYRATVEATARRALDKRLSLGLRGFAAVSTGENETAKQRQVYVAGADPLEELTNPFLRSRGALLTRKDVNYQAAGGGGLRGYDPRLSVPALVAANVELERVLVQQPRGRLFRQLAVAAFLDAGQAIGDEAGGFGTGTVKFLADAGVGLRAEHRIGESTVVTRVDLPLFVSRPGVAQDRHPGADRAGFRWLFSFERAW